MAGMNYFLTNAGSAIFQIYSGQNKLIFNETSTLRWIFIVLAHWSNSPRVDMSLHSDTLFWLRANKSLLSLLNACVLRGEATNTNFTVFGLTRPRLEHTIYHTRGEHANHYATDAVQIEKRRRQTPLVTYNDRLS